MITMLFTLRNVANAVMQQLEDLHGNKQAALQALHESTVQCWPLGADAGVLRQFDVPNVSTPSEVPCSKCVYANSHPDQHCMFSPLSSSVWHVTAYLAVAQCSLCVSAGFLPTGDLSVVAPSSQPAWCMLALLDSVQHIALH